MPPPASNHPESWWPRFCQTPFLHPGKRTDTAGLLPSPHLQNHHHIQPNRKKHSWTISNTAKCRLLHSHRRHQKLSSNIQIIEFGISIVQLYTMIIIINILNLFFHHHQVLICLIPRCFLPPRWFRANKALYSRLTGGTTVESIIHIAWY